MSALPPKADIGTQSRNVRFVPKADIKAKRCASAAADTGALVQAPDVIAPAPAWSAWQQFAMFKVAWRHIIHQERSGGPR